MENIVPTPVDAVTTIMDNGADLPAHCTGWNAQVALAQRMPEAYMPNAVGATFEL